jgi:alkylation response protein AidB-like acyl-CoA dehydrogenase
MKVFAAEERLWLWVSLVTMGNAQELAQEIADNVLFPAATEVDQAGVIPASHLDLLADKGFYGLSTAVDDDAPEIVATLASGCLCTTFVWLQHQGVVIRVANSHLRAEWLPDLTAGRRRAGVALGGTLPGRPLLVAQPGPDGYVLNGRSPWVTGWGMVDVLAVVARDRDNLAWLLVDAKESDTLTVDPLRMVAVTASNTVTAHFKSHHVPAGRVIRTQPYAEWAQADRANLRFNASLALGLTRRCLTLLGPTRLDDELADVRTHLDTADPQDMPTARARASELAMRAATTLVASTGSQAVVAGQNAERLAREAMFLLVFGSRPAIKQSLVELLSRG